MTRVNTEQLKYPPWFAKAGAACSIVPIARFVNDRIFALKGGGYPWLIYTKELSRNRWPRISAAFLMLLCPDSCRSLKERDVNSHAYGASSMKVQSRRFLSNS